MKTLLLTGLTALNLLLGTATGNTESAHGRAVPSDCQRQESKSQKGNGIREVCTRLSEKQKEPSSTDVFLVSYDKPQTILSSTIKGYVKQPSRAYVYVNENMYAINFGENKSITPLSFTPVHASDRLSPLITVGSLSRSDPFVSNVIENAGSCYLLPEQLPPVTEYAVRNMPEHWKVQACSAEMHEGKILLCVSDPTTKKRYYAFFHPDSSLMDRNVFETKCSHEYTSTYSGLVWDGDYVIEVQASKWKEVEYQIYSLKEQRIIDYGCISLGSDDVLVIMEKSLFLVNVTKNNITQLQKK